MTLQDIMAIAGTLIAFAGYGTYIWGIFREGIKPHLFTWLIWGIVMAVGFAAQYAEAAGPGMWITGIATIITFIITLLAWRRGEKHITRSDWAFFVAALAAIPLWAWTSTPLYAVILISLIDALAFYPTFRKSWMKPWDEKILSYTLVGLQFMLSVIGMKVINLTTTLYPMTIVVLNIALIALLIARRRIIARPA